MVIALPNRNITSFMLPLSPCRHPSCIGDDRLLTWPKPCRRAILPTPTSTTGCQVPKVPASPRWLLAIPDAIHQLNALDRPLLTRRDLEALFGVSRARAATLMRAFGADIWWSARRRTRRRNSIRRMSSSSLPKQFLQR